MYGDPALDEKPELLAKRGGAFYSEAAVDLAASLLGGGGSPVQVVNTYNNGTLPFLADDAVIEVPARVSTRRRGAAAGARARPAVRGADRARHRVRGPGPGGRPARRARPGVPGAARATRWSGSTTYADELTDRLIAHNREHLAWA